MTPSLTDLRDRMAQDETQICHCAGFTCCGCQEKTRRLFCLAFDKGAEEERKRAQVLVDAVNGIKDQCETNAAEFDAPWDSLYQDVLDALATHEKATAG